MVAACANPAALSGGSGELRAYLARDGRSIVSATPPKPWVNEPLTGTSRRSVPPIDTPWVSVPGMLTAQCASNDNATYLEATVHADPSGRRVNDIVGDLGANGQIAAEWGLHLVDVNLAIGNLVDIVRQQSKSWLRPR